MPLLADIDADTGLLLGITQTAVFACALWLVVFAFSVARRPAWRRPLLRTLYALIGILLISVAGLLLSA